MTPEEVAAKIADLVGRTPRRSGSSWSVRCPAHEDRKPSLSVGTGRDGKVLIKCHTGCSVEAVLAAAGLTWADMFIDPPKRRSEVVAEYTYTDQFDKPVFQVRRYFPKDFRAFSPDGRGGWRSGLNGACPVLYRLPKVIAAVKAGQNIYVVEGEKDVHAIERAGGVATTARSAPASRTCSRTCWSART